MDGKLCRYFTEMLRNRWEKKRDRQWQKTEIDYGDLLARDEVSYANVLLQNKIIIKRK